VTFSASKSFTIPPLPKKPWKPQKPYSGTTPPSSWAGVWSGIRFGFVPHEPRFHHKPPFHYGHYVTDPSEGLCFPSIWYFYSSMPAYVGSEDIEIDSSAPDDANGMVDSGTGGADQAAPTDAPALVQPTNTAPDGTSFSPDADPGIQAAEQDLIKAWKEGDPDSIEHLLPADGKVTVKVEGADSYELDSKDFADLFQDGILDLDTVSYKFVAIESLPDGSIELHAEHQFTDSFGQEGTIDQAYVLTLEGGGYVIREFRTSSYK
jgi:hypothetical protein